MYAWSFGSFPEVVKSPSLGEVEPRVGILLIKHLIYRQRCDIATLPKVSASVKNGAKHTEEAEDILVPRRRFKDTQSKPQLLMP